MKKSFWMVYNPEGGSPRVAHQTMRSANAEAERLATQNPGTEFFVLQAVSVSKKIEVITTRLEPHGEDYDPPF